MYLPKHADIDAEPSVFVLVLLGHAVHSTELFISVYEFKGQSAHGARPVGEYWPGGQISVKKEFVNQSRRFFGN